MQPTKKRRNGIKPDQTVSLVAALIGATAVIISALISGLFVLIGANTKPNPPSSNISSLIFVLIGITAVLIIVSFAVSVSLFRRRQSSRTIDYSTRIGQLTHSLTEASADVDRILQEMTQIIRERQSAISTLEQKRTELQTEIDSLEKGPAETVKLFTQFLENQDKKGRKRDFILFGLGALISILGTILGLLVTGSIHLFGH